MVTGENSIIGFSAYYWNICNVLQYTPFAWFFDGASFCKKHNLHN